MMRLAIIGTGISGLTCAHLLQGDHDLVIYEAGDYVGGHTNTVDVRGEDGGWAVDTGFIVFNDWTYPNFIKLLGRLGVESQESSMSFSVRCERTGLEYNGTTLDTLFAQRSNIFNPAFIKMVRDIFRFNKDSLKLLESAASETDSLTLRGYLASRSYSKYFVDKYLVPIGASIWSANPSQFDQIPASYFVSFLRNHGMLNINDRPTWRVIKGGSRTYVQRLIAPLRDKIRLRTPVASVTRNSDHVVVSDGTGNIERFDNVILACHSNQALAMLSDPTPAEREILGAIPYQPNPTILHTDAGVLPQRRKAWAAWNYHLPRSATEAVPITYNMNILQRLNSQETYCVTLNRGEEIARDRILREIQYEHPVYTSNTVAAQRRWEEINGHRGTWYCGAYWGYGFHEDGVKSGLRVCERFGRTL